MARRAGSNSEETWEKLVAAAREALTEGGVGALSLRGVAREAGHRLGTLQYYFPTRDDLVEAVLGEQYRRLDRGLRDAAADLQAGTPLPEVAATLSVEFYRVARRCPRLCRARVVTNLLGRAMSTESRNALETAARRIQRACPTPLDERELVLGLHTLSVLLLRYGAHSDEELAAILGEEDPARAVERAEAHLARLARDTAERIERASVAEAA